MRIDHYSSEQFAGVRDHDVKFEPGMNVVLGNNETGKSTMIAAIFYALTQSTKLDKRRDSAFIEHYFPTRGAKTIDSSVSFTQNGESYVLTKLWDITGQDTGFKLRRVGGDTLRGNQAEDELKSLMQFGFSVYSNLIFGRQNHEEEILQWCYNFFAQKSDESVDVVRKQIGSAVSAASGISPEKIIAEIDKRLSKLGDRWDFARNAPERKTGAGRRWEKGLGDILKAWYNFEDADNAYQDAKDAEKSIASTTRKLETAKSEQADIKDRKAKLLEQKGSVDNIANLQELKHQSGRALDKARKALLDWPIQEERVTEGERLLALKEERERKEKKSDLKKRISKIKKINEEIKELQQDTTSWSDFKRDFEEALDLENDIALNRATLSAATLHATIKMAGNHMAQVDLGGKLQSVKELDCNVSGYFSMTIPGIAEVLVEPPEIDVKSIQQRIEDAQQRIDEILDEYCVSELSALEDLSEEYEEDIAKLDKKNTELEALLDSKTLEEYSRMLEEIDDDPSIRIPHNLDDLIESYLRGNRVLDVAISLAKNAINGYQGEYSTIDSLKETINHLEASIESQEDRIGKLSLQSDISKEQFDMLLKECNEKLHTLDRQIGEYQTVLGQLGEPANVADFEFERDRLKDEWESLKRMHCNYQKIKEDFLACQKQDDHRFDDFHAKFNEYLSAISGDSLTMNDDNGLLLTSGQNPVNKDILSAGTRKTVLLAFRLAVLSYYFPNGDGLIVLDDDLLDMDPDRRLQAAALLKSFSEKNQIIFTTCDPAIAELLGGNQIKICNNA